MRAPRWPAACRVLGLMADGGPPCLAGSRFAVSRLAARLTGTMCGMVPPAAGWPRRTYERRRCHAAQGRSIETGSGGRLGHGCRAGCSREVFPETTRGSARRGGRRKCAQRRPNRRRCCWIAKTDSGGGAGCFYWFCAAAAAGCCGKDGSDFERTAWRRRFVLCLCRRPP